MCTEDNREAAVSFLKLAACVKASEAFSTFAGAEFRHHNPFFEGVVGRVA